MIAFAKVDLPEADKPVIDSHQFKQLFPLHFLCFCEGDLRISIAELIILIGAEINRLEKFLKIYGADYFVSKVNGNNRFEKIINQYILASLTSKALANKLGVNPEDIETIESFKKLS